MFFDGARKAHTPVTLIGCGTTFDGYIKVDNVLEIYGLVRGMSDGYVITSSCKVVVAEEGTVTGCITAKDVAIAGVVTGDIAATGLVELFKTCRLIGNIQCAHLIVEGGAIFNGVVSVTRPAAGVDSSIVVEST